jgi:hypothetical protein
MFKVKSEKRRTGMVATCDVCRRVVTADANVLSWWDDGCTYRIACKGRCTET